MVSALSPASSTTGELHCATPLRQEVPTIGETYTWLIEMRSRTVPSTLVSKPGTKQYAAHSHWRHLALPWLHRLGGLTTHGVIRKERTRGDECEARLGASRDSSGSMMSIALGYAPSFPFPVCLLSRLGTRSLTRATLSAAAFFRAGATNVSKMKASSVSMRASRSSTVGFQPLCAEALPAFTSTSKCSLSCPLISLRSSR
jgi:hypothetical protein